MITRLLLALEVLFFSGNYLVSNNGLHAIMILKRENNELSFDIMHIKKELHILENELIVWHTYPFYKEKVAREQLHMTKQNESIYYIS